VEIQSKGQDMKVAEDNAVDVLGALKNEAQKLEFELERLNVVRARLRQVRIAISALEAQPSTLKHSARTAAIAVLEGGPLPVEDIFREVMALGVQTSDHSLRAVLSRDKKAFTRVGRGRWGLAGSVKSK